MVDPTDVAVQVSTLADSVPLTPDPDHIGLNATWHTIAGDDITYGIQFANGSKEQVQVIVRKTSASETIITVDCPNACSQGFTTEHDSISHMQAGNATPTTKVLGPWPKGRWATTIGVLTDRVKLTFSGATTGLEVLILRTPVVSD